MAALVALGYWNESISELMCNNPKEDHVDMSAYIKLGEIMSIFSQDIERKRNLREDKGP